MPAKVGAEPGGIMHIGIKALFVTGGKVYIVAEKGDIFPVPSPPRLSLALERIKENGYSEPFFDVSRAQIVCESASAIFALRRMLWQLLPPEVAGKIIPLPTTQQIPVERKLALVVGE